MRTQQRGPITDSWPDGPGELAVCECVHGKRWPEGDRCEPDGAACPVCVAEWKADRLDGPTELCNSFAAAPRERGR